MHSHIMRQFRMGNLLDARCAHIQYFTYLKDYKITEPNRLLALFIIFIIVAADIFSSRTASNRFSMHDARTSYIVHLQASLE